MTLARPLLLTGQTPGSCAYLQRWVARVPMEVWGFTVPASDEQTTAASMLRFWGQDAAKVAFGYAQEHDKAGDTKPALYWYNVTRVVLEFGVETNVARRAHG
jgi:hypothetical protein